MVFPHVEGHLVLFWGNFEFCFLNTYFVAEPVLYHTNPYVWEWVDHPQGLGEALQPHHPAPSGRCRLPPLGTNAPGRAAAISLGGFPGGVPGDLLVRPAPKPDAGGASGRSRSWERQLQELEFELYDIYLQYSYWLSW